MQGYAQLEGSRGNVAPLRWCHLWAVCCSMLSVVFCVHVVTLEGFSFPFRVFETQVRITEKKKVGIHNLVIWPSRIAKGSAGQGKQWFDIRPRLSPGQYGQQRDQHRFHQRIQAERRPEEGVQEPEENPRTPTPSDAALRNARSPSGEAASKSPSKPRPSSMPIIEEQSPLDAFLDAAIPPAIGCLVIGLMLETYHYTNGFWGNFPADPIVPLFGGVPLTEAVILLSFPGFILTTVLGLVKGNN